MRRQVSILLVTYHTQEHPRVPWLRESIDSILGQKGVDLDLLVLDNGSTWEAASLLEAYGDRIQRFRFEKNMERNPWKYLGQHARSDYVAFFCDDDVMLPGCLEKSAEALEAHPDCGLAYGSIREEALGFRDLVVHDFIPWPGTVFRREFLRHLPEDMLPLVGDWQFWLEIAARSGLWRIPEKLVAIREHPDSDTNRRGFGECGFAPAHLKLWRHWIQERGFRPTAGEWQRMMEFLQYYLEASSCSFREGLGWMRQLYGLREKTEKPSIMARQG